MQYYLLLPGDTEADCELDSNLLGEASFNSFYTGAGMKALLKIVNQTPQLLTTLTIKTDRNESISVEEFLTRINQLKVIG